MKYRNIRQYDFQLMENINILVDMPNIVADDSIVCRFIDLVDGRLYFSKYYCWDGSSIPFKRWYRWLWNADKYCKEASLVHDALCQLIRNGYLPLSLRIEADKLYRQMCIEGGMKKWEADERYKFLRKFGGKKVKIADNPILEVKHG